MTVHTFLEEPRVLRNLTTMVRRRVPACEADDVVQSVLCDVLAARAVPQDDELPRWVVGDPQEQGGRLSSTLAKARGGVRRRSRDPLAARRL